MIGASVDRHPQTSPEALTLAFDAMLARSRASVEQSRSTCERSNALCTRVRQSRRPRIRGGSDSEVTRTERTLDKLQQGSLPAPLGGNVWFGAGSGKRCNGCGDIISRDEREFEAQVSAALIFRFHAECYGAWTAFSGDGGSSSREPRASGPEPISNS